MKVIASGIAAVAIALAIAIRAFAQSDAPNAGVEWILPTSPPAVPQTDAEKEHGMNFGRALPPLEVLRPSLDSQLPIFHPQPGLHLRAHYKAASSDVLPGLAKAWVAAFRKYYPDVRIDVDPPYEGSIGAKELVKGTIDFVFVSRELKPDDITDFRAKFGYDPTSIPVSGGSYRHFGFLDAVGFIVNEANPIETLSYSQIDALFSSTHFRSGKAATTWGDLGLTGDWADKPVHLVGIKPWNGFEEFVRQRVLSTPGHRGEWRDGIDFSPTVFPIAAKVTADRYALAYDGMAYLTTPVKVLAVRMTNDGPPIAPSYENVATADYPLSRLIYFNTNKAPGKALAPAEAEFLRFILSREGQAIVQEQGVYMPLRASQVAGSLKLVQQ